MALPENYSPRRGDRLSVVGTVNHDSITYVFLEAGIGDDTVEISIPLNLARKVCEVEAYKWRVGDKVWAPHENVWGEIVYVDGDDWVCVKATKAVDPDMAKGLYVWSPHEICMWHEAAETEAPAGPVPAAEQPPPPTGW